MGTFLSAVLHVVLYVVGSIGALGVFLVFVYFWLVVRPLILVGKREESILGVARFGFAMALMVSLGLVPIFGWWRWWYLLFLVGTPGLLFLMSMLFRALGKITALRLRGLRSRNETVREAVVAFLGELGDERAVTLLIDTLRDEERSVRMSAAEVLGRLGDVRAVEPLIKMLGDGDAHVRCAAAVALGELGDSRAVEPLIEALGDEDGRVRRATAAALGELGDSRAVEPLIEALGDGVADFRRAAAIALMSLGEPEWEGYVFGNPWDFSRLGRSKDPRALGPLIKGLIRELGARTWDVRKMAARGLTAIRKRNLSLPIQNLKEVRDLVTARHQDAHEDRRLDPDGLRPTDCHGDHADNHNDTGIGLDFPDAPLGEGKADVPLDF